MHLNFDAKLVQKLLEHSAAAAERKPCYEQLYDLSLRKEGKAPESGTFPDQDEIDISKIPAGLWLVGDHGIYLMSNGLPFLKAANGMDNLVAYAKECDPIRMEFDAWYAIKRAVFGGDDGVEFLNAEIFARSLQMKDRHITLDVTPQSIGILE